MLAESLNSNGEIYPSIPFYKKNCDFIELISEAEMMKIVELQQELAKQMENRANYAGALEHYMICL